MNIALKTIEKVLKEACLLKEFIYQTNWSYELPIEDRKLTSVSYDSRDVSSETLFFCKGLNFKEDYLISAASQGLTVYISEEPYDIDVELGIIVTDIRKAMALISMAFYNYPQQKLTLIGYTGTKGKTTAAYFTKFMLDHSTHKKTAMLSTMNTTLDGVTFFKSKLTTPESLDLYRMMNEAVDNGMTHLIMEVSSQAYKVERVFGLTFDVGIFMNISPDHISPIEHPTFDDYYYCKRQLILNSKRMILNKDCQDFKLLEQTAKAFDIPVLTYSSSDKMADYYWTATPDSSLGFTVESEEDPLNIHDRYDINLMGDFNKDNALAGIMASTIVGASRSDCKKGLNEALVPGRMEHLIHKNGANVYVDYAHNYLSLKNLLSFAKKEHPDGQIITVIGSPGDKAISRREDFGAVLSELTDVVILTTDDPAHEDPKKIATEISDAITNKHVSQYIELDREAAIKQAIDMSSSMDSVILAGKGTDLYQKVGHIDELYKGDYAIAKEYIEK